MRTITRTLAGVALTTGLALIPAVQLAHAASSPVRLTACAPQGQIQIPAPDVASVASVVGVTPQVLQQDLASGQTILQVAGGRFASADDLATALLANVKDKLDHAAAAGALAAAQEAAIYAQAHSAYAQLVVTLHPALQADAVGAPDARKAAGGGSVAKAVFALPDAGFVASVVGVTPRALQQYLASGQTILQIAANRYASANDLATALLVNMKAKLDRVVAAGKMTSDEENAIYTQAHSAYVRLVSMPHPVLASTDSSETQHKVDMASCGKA